MTHNTWQLSTLNKWEISMRIFFTSLLMLAVTVSVVPPAMSQELVRQNELITKLIDGQTTHGVIIRNRSVETGRMLRTSGLDFVIIDMEHEAYDFSAVEDVLLGLREQPFSPGVREQAGEMAPLRNSARPPLTDSSVPVPLVKIARLGREHVQFEVRHALKLGAMGVFVAYAETGAQVAEAIAAARKPESHYVPRFSTEDWISRNDPWPLSTNGEFIVGAMIESKRGEENIDEILDTPGLSVLWLAHPSSAEVAMSILEKCREKNILALVYGADVDRWKIDLESGDALMIQLGWDTDLFYRGLDYSLKQLEVESGSQE